jgi:sugar phosphate isomerase/epimerase
MIAGIFTRTYAEKSAHVFDLVKRDGFAAAQLNLISLGLESLPLTIDLAQLTAAAAAAQRAGVTLVALSGTYNMAHPDKARRLDARPRFENVCRAAAAMEIGLVTLCTGSRDGANMWAHHAENKTPAAMRDLRAEMDWALDVAARHGLTLAIEPEPGNVIADARIARRFLNEVKSDRLKIILDAANLLPPEALPRQHAVMDEAVALLGADTVLAHGKDIDAQGHVVAPGQGAVDLAHFVRALRKANYKGALVAHGFEEKDAKTAAAALTKLIAEVT